MSGRQVLLARVLPLRAVRCMQNKCESILLFFKLHLFFISTLCVEVCIYSMCVCAGQRATSGSQVLSSCHVGSRVSNSDHLASVFSLLAIHQTVRVNAMGDFPLEK